MSELSALLEAVRTGRDDDTPRLVLADWLDEHHQALTVRRGELPTGFNDHWHRNVMYATLGLRGTRRGRGKWSNAEILAGLDASARLVGVKWAARVGAAEIGGHPVLVSEPNLGQPRTLDVCRSLQWAAGGCPVSFNRCPQRGRCGSRSGSP